MLNLIKSRLILLVIISLALMPLACGKEAQTLSPETKITSAVGSEPGYFYPVMVASYPSGLSVPKNTKIILVFNIPVNPAALIAANVTVNSSVSGMLTNGVHYTLTAYNTPTTVALITFIGGANPRPDNDTITVSYTSGIVSLDGNVPLSNPGSFNFTTGTAVNTVSPVVSVINPSAAGVSVTAPNIYVDFTTVTDIDPVTINASTIYVTAGGNRIETTYAYNNVLKRATLTPTSHLINSTVHTITVKGGGVIRDITGNGLTGADQTQNFTTALAPFDPYGISPSITNGPAITSIDKVSALVTWVTDQPTDHTFNYSGKAGSLGPVTSAVFNPFHAVSLAALTAGERYWVTLNAADYKNNANNTGLNNFLNIPFNTVTPEIHADIHSAAGDQFQSVSLPQKFSVANSGNYIFWVDAGSGTTQIYGQLFTSTLATPWVAPKPIFTEAQNFAYFSSAEDEEGGVVIAVSRAGVDIYSKRVTSAGAIFDWGAGSQAATDAGFSIRSAGGITNVSVVPVYTGIVQQIRSGTTEMNYLSWGDRAVYDDTGTISIASAVVNNDIIMSETTHKGSTVNKATQDHDYFLQKNTAPSGEYTGITSGSAAGKLICAGKTWNTAPDIIAVGTLVYNSTLSVFATVTAVDSDTQLSLSSDIFTAAGQTFYLNDINSYFIADNTLNKISSTSTTHLVNDPVTVNDYTPGNDMVYTPHAFATAGWMGIEDVINSGTNYGRITAGPVTIAILSIDIVATANSVFPNRIYDGTGPFGSVVAGDLVYNADTFAYAHVLTPIDAKQLTLDSPIFTTPPVQNYILYQKKESGTGSTNMMYKSTGTAVGVGDYVINTSTSPLSLSNTVTAFTGSDLVLSANIFSSATDNYIILDSVLPTGEYTGTNTGPLTANKLLCTGKTWNTAPDIITAGSVVYNFTRGTFARVNTIDSDTQLGLSADIFNIATGDTFYIYPVKDSGTATSVNTARLYKSGAAWTGYNLLTGGAGVVENTTTPGYGVISTVPSNEELTFGSALFPANSQNYIIYKWISTNTASTLVPFHMTRAAANWVALPVVAGDLVHNNITPAFGKVVTRNSATELTLDTDIFSATAESYDIYHRYCTTHPGNTSIQSFYSLKANWNIGILDAAGFNLYDYRNITGTAVAPPLRPLFDNNPATAFNAGTVVAANDIVINYSTLNLPNDPNVGTVITAPYAIHAKALGVSHPGFGMFANSENYEIIRLLNSNTTSADIIDTGIATSTSLNQLVDSSTLFTGAPVVQVGDIVYNLSSDTYASVKTVAANTLTLSRNIFSVNNRYVIIRKKGLLYVWQEGSTVQGRIVTMGPAGSAPADLRAMFLITAGTNPKAVPDGWGSALVIYQDTAGIPQIQAIRVDGRGNISVAATPVDAQAALSETIVSVQSDGANGAVILYKYSDGTLHVQRINNSCVVQWGANGRSIGNGADATSQEFMAFDPVSGDVIVAANVSNDIKAARVGAASWVWKFIVQDPAVQQNPSAFISAGNDFIVWDDARFYSTANLIMGYGIFGVKINPATGLVVPAWYANSWAGPDAQNGVSLVFSNLQRGFPVVKLVPYNNGAGVMMIWNDYSTPGNSSDLVFIDPNLTGGPYFPVGITTPY